MDNAEEIYVYLKGFENTTSYLKADGSHIAKEAEQKQQFNGNFLFASLNACRGNIQSRRDDIESVFYLLVYLLNNQKLPWSNINPLSENCSFSLREALQHRLRKVHTMHLFQQIPFQLQRCLKDVMTISFEEAPPYDKIIKSLQSCCD